LPIHHRRQDGRSGRPDPAQRRLTTQGPTNTVERRGSGGQEGARVNNRLVAEWSVQQSVKVEEAAWISGRLSPFDSCVVTSVVPYGFEAYPRVLHPLDPPARGQQSGRWADVASWRATELTRGIDFPDIVLPEHGPPSGVEPWPGQVPQVGTLHPADAEALAAVLARHTGTPDGCWSWTREGCLSQPMALIAP
jgi:hypothetical protein